STPASMPARFAAPRATSCRAAPRCAGTAPRRFRSRRSAAAAAVTRCRSSRIATARASSCPRPRSKPRSRSARAADPLLARLVAGSLRARRSRVLLALLAVTLGTGVATALGTLALQIGDDLARTLRATGPNFLLRPEGAAWKPDVGGDTPVVRAG